MVSPDRLRAMHSAVVQGDEKKILLLLKAGVAADSGPPDSNITFLKLAATCALPRAFFLLIEHGASIHVPGLLAHAVGGNGGRGPVSMEIVRHILAHTTPTQAELDDALNFACAAGSLEAVQELLTRSANINHRHEKYRHFPLQTAVYGGNVEIVRLLLATGADPTFRVDCQDDMGNWRTRPGTIADEARKEGQEEIARLLEKALG